MKSSNVLLWYVYISETYCAAKEFPEVFWYLLRLKLAIANISSSFLSLSFLFLIRIPWHNAFYIKEKVSGYVQVHRHLLGFFYKCVYFEEFQLAGEFPIYCGSLRVENILIICPVDVCFFLPSLINLSGSQPVYQSFFFSPFIKSQEKKYGIHNDSMMINSPTPIFIHKLIKQVKKTTNKRIKLRKQSKYTNKTNKRTNEQK